jgi:chaperone LolA
MRRRDACIWWARGAHLTKDNNVENFVDRINLADRRRGPRNRPRPIQILRRRHQVGPRRIHPDAGHEITQGRQDVQRHLRVRAPRQIHLDLPEPYEQLLQADGETLYLYDKDLNQVTTRKLGGALGNSPAAILFGSNDLEKNFTLAEAGTHDGLEWLNATPKSKDTTFEQIGIGLKDGTPQAMELKDSFGRTVLLKFTSFQRNPALGPQTFKFEVPKGAEVVNQ